MRVIKGDTRSLDYRTYGDSKRIAGVSRQDYFEKLAFFSTQTEI